jgi:hypothetical protein
MLILIRLLLALVIFAMASACATAPPPVMGRGPSREARYRECLASERQKAAVAKEIASAYGVEAKDVASPKINRCDHLIAPVGPPVFVGGGSYHHQSQVEKSAWRDGQSGAPCSVFGGFAETRCRQGHQSRQRAEDRWRWSQENRRW